MTGQDPFRSGPKKSEAAEKCSAGVPPAIFLSSSNRITIRTRGRLPHWEARDAVYFVTFRLADSLPKKALAQIKFARTDIPATAAQMARTLSVTERIRLKNLHARRIEGLLDAGTGKCYLRGTLVAKCVVDVLRHFDGTRYQLYAWCVMPNHVHVVFRTLGDNTLEGILHSWKSYSSKKVNELLGRSGEFWQHEYFDHLIRNNREFERALRYVVENPEKARLKDWPWVWSII
jgi:REP element-mobilizing transposase RayT